MISRLWALLVVASAVAQVQSQTATATPVYFAPPGISSDSTYDYWWPFPPPSPVSTASTMSSPQESSSLTSASPLFPLPTVSPSFISMISRTQITSPTSTLYTSSSTDSIIRITATSNSNALTNGSPPVKSHEFSIVYLTPLFAVLGLVCGATLAGMVYTRYITKPKDALVASDALHRDDDDYTHKNERFTVPPYQRTRSVMVELGGVLGHNGEEDGGLPFIPGQPGAGYHRRVTDESFAERMRRLHQERKFHSNTPPMSLRGLPLSPSKHSALAVLSHKLHSVIPNSHSRNMHSHTTQYPTDDLANEDDTSPLVNPMDGPDDKSDPVSHRTEYLPHSLHPLPKERQPEEVSPSAATPSAYSEYNEGDESTPTHRSHSSIRRTIAERLRLGSRRQPPPATVGLGLSTEKGARPPHSDSNRDMRSEVRTKLTNDHVLHDSRGIGVVPYDSTNTRPQHLHVPSALNSTDLSNIPSLPTPAEPSVRKASGSRVPHRLRGFGDDDAMFPLGPDGVDSRVSRRRRVTPLTDIAPTSSPPLHPVNMVEQSSRNRHSSNADQHYASSHEPFINDNGVLTKPSNVSSAVSLPKSKKDHDLSHESSDHLPSTTTPPVLPLQIHKSKLQPIDDSDPITRLRPCTEAPFRLSPTHKLPFSTPPHKRKDVSLNSTPPPLPEKSTRIRHPIIRADSVPRGNAHILSPPVHPELFFADPVLGDYVHTPEMDAYEQRREEKRRYTQALKGEDTDEKSKARKRAKLKKKTMAGAHDEDGSGSHDVENFGTPSTVSSISTDPIPSTRTKAMLGKVEEIVKHSWGARAVSSGGGGANGDESLSHEARSVAGLASPEVVATDESMGIRGRLEALKRLEGNVMQ